MIRGIVTLAVAAAAVVSVAACTSDAQVASDNLSKEADNFEVPRRIVAVNGITDKYILEVVGYCNIHVDREDHQLEITCKTGPEEFVKDFYGLSDNATYFVEQVEPKKVSTDHVQVNFHPETLIPDIEKR